MREVLSRAAAGDPRAVLGRDVYLHRLRASIAAMAAAMDGLDAIVFTGGVGENSAEIRYPRRGRPRLPRRPPSTSRATPGMAPTTGRSAPTARGCAPSSIAAREDKQIAGEVRSVLAR